MAIKRPKIVIIGAGMAGLAAANKLQTFPGSERLFEISVVEGGSRIGGRISTAEFFGDRVEQGATFIHGIEGSPVYRIARDTGLLEPDGPWECMDGIPHRPITVAEGGHVVPPSRVEPVSTLFKGLMDFSQGKEDPAGSNEIVRDILSRVGSGNGAQPEPGRSLGAFLKEGMQAYLGKTIGTGVEAVGDWETAALLEAIFAVHESTQRTHTAADDLHALDYGAEREYVMFPGEEITIARGYSSVVESIASVLPAEMIQLDRRVQRIEWCTTNGNDTNNRPVKLHFNNGSIMVADHVIVTVSLGVLKQGIRLDSPLFNPTLPGCKVEAISRLGYGIVNKVFLHQETNYNTLPFLQMAFHPSNSELRNPNIPHWIRRTSSLNPIYHGSRTMLSWFTGQEALELESLTEEEIISGFSVMVSNMLPSQFNCNGSAKDNQLGIPKFNKMLRTKWGSDPLFLGSYSFIAIGSSTDDIDALADPLPLTISNPNSDDYSSPPQLQILFAGEATHPTQYSTTHGAYFSGVREANRLLKHYKNYINAA